MKLFGLELPLKDVVLRPFVWTENQIWELFIWSGLLLSLEMFVAPSHKCCCWHKWMGGPEVGTRKGFASFGGGVSVCVPQSWIHASFPSASRRNGMFMYSMLFSCALIPFLFQGFPLAIENHVWQRRTGRQAPRPSRPDEQCYLQCRGQRSVGDQPQL